MIYCLSFRKMSSKTKKDLHTTLIYVWLILRRRSHVMSHIYIKSLQIRQDMSQTLCPNTFSALQNVLSCCQWDVLYRCMLAETHIHLTFEVESSEMFPDVLKLSENMAHLKKNCFDCCLYLLRTWCSGYYWCPDVLWYFCILYKCVPFIFFFRIIHFSRHHFSDECVCIYALC